jgi:NTE family protein
MRLTFFFLFLTLISCSSVDYTIFVPGDAPEFKKNYKPEVVLVLGGGGAKGLAHLGVLEIFERNNIKIDMIVGSSAGAIIGAFYCDNPSIKHIKDIFINLKKEDLIEDVEFNYYTFPLMITGPVSGKKMRYFLANNLLAEKFSDLKIPLTVVSTDMQTAKTVAINSGHLVPAIHASSALPMVFKPVYLYGMTLSDGAIASPVPVSIAKQFSPKIIIAVNISQKPSDKKLSNNFDVVSRALDITYYQFTLRDLKGADVVINPEIKDMGILDDHRNDELYEAGVAAAQKAMPRIKKLISERMAN